MFNEIAVEIGISAVNCASPLTFYLLALNQLSINEREEE